jgi:hypothetical protein
MSLISDAEAAVATGGWSLYLKMAWKALPWVLALVFLAAWRITCGTLEGERAGRKLDRSEAARVAAESNAAWELALRTAGESYIARRDAALPIIVHATDTVREYAQTPAGRAVCASPDRVRATDALDAALWPATGPAGGGNEAVHTDAAPPASGRGGDRGR